MPKSHVENAIPHRFIPPTTPIEKPIPPTPQCVVPMGFHNSQALAFTMPPRPSLLLPLLHRWYTVLSIYRFQFVSARWRCNFEIHSFPPHQHVCVCMYVCNHLQKHPFLQWLEPKVNGVMVRVALPFVPVGATCAVFFFLLPLMYASFTADSGYRRVVTFTGHKHSPTYTLIYR